MQVNAREPRHVDFNVHAATRMIAPAKMHLIPAGGHVERNLIAALVVEDLQPVLADLPVLRGHADLNGVFVPWFYADVTVTGFHAKVRLAIEIKGLIPFVGKYEET